MYVHYELKPEMPFLQMKMHRTYTVSILVYLCYFESKTYRTRVSFIIYIIRTIYFLKRITLIRHH